MGFIIKNFLEKAFRNGRMVPCSGKLSLARLTVGNREANHGRGVTR